MASESNDRVQKGFILKFACAVVSRTTAIASELVLPGTPQHNTGRRHHRLESKALNSLILVYAPDVVVGIGESDRSIVRLFHRRFLVWEHTTKPAFRAAVILAS